MEKVYYVYNAQMVLIKTNMWALVFKHTSHTKSDKPLNTCYLAHPTAIQNQTF